MVVGQRKIKSYLQKLYSNKTIGFVFTHYFSLFGKNPRRFLTTKLDQLQLRSLEWDILKINSKSQYVSINGLQIYNAC
jgi:hypothetical protein